MRTRVGYCGGEYKQPSYYDMEDHTESVQVEYDPQILSYEDVLQLFWKGHDYKHNTKSVQYRRVLFYHNEEQRQQAEESKKELEETGPFNKPIVTSPPQPFIFGIFGPILISSKYAR